MKDPYARLTKTVKRSIVIAMSPKHDNTSLVNANMAVLREAKPFMDKESKGRLKTTIKNYREHNNYD